MNNKTSNYLSDETGAVAIITAVVLVFVLLGIAALAIDIGRLNTTKNELQNAADAAALAGARELGRKHLNEIEIDQNAVSDITSAAKDAAEENIVGNQNFSLNLDGDDEIIIGYWTENSFSHTGERLENAVNVILNEDSATSFFARVFGVERFNPTVYATAALTGTSKIDEGDSIPVGISKYWFEHDWTGDFCDQPIRFYPTNDIEGCAGWHTYDLSPANSSTLRKDIFEGMLDGDFQSPEMSIGSTAEFFGGVSSSAFCNPSDQQKDFQDLWEKYKDENNEWKTKAVVYDRDDCSNPNEELEILGFVTVIIEEVICAPEKEINAQVICDEFTEFRGGGGDYGTYGTIPNLVQ